MANENYLAPGGKEYTLTAGQLAGLNAKSKILDIACGRGVASINLAKKFGSHFIAVDIENSLIQEGKDLAEKEKVADKIKFVTADFNTLAFKKNSFDMIIAEGGALSYIGRNSGLQKAYALLKKSGYIEISDLIIRSKHLPKAVKETFAANMDLETEDSYRTLLKIQGFEIVFCSHIASHYWHSYYENIKQNLKNRKGVFSDKNLRENLTKEMELFYKQKASEQVGYIFIVAKKS